MLKINDSCYFEKYDIWILTNRTRNIIIIPADKLQLSTIIELNTFFSNEHHVKFVLFDFFSPEKRACTAKNNLVKIQVW